MSTVKLRTNIVVEGKFIPFGTVMDEDKVPPTLRKRKYILREGEPDPDEHRLNKQQQVAEQGGEAIFDPDPIFADEHTSEEDNQRIHLASKRAAIRRNG